MTDNHSSRSNNNNNNTKLANVCNSSINNTHFSCNSSFIFDSTYCDFSTVYVCLSHFQIITIQYNTKILRKLQSFWPNVTYVSSSYRFCDPASYCQIISFVCVVWVWWNGDKHKWMAMSCNISLDSAVFSERELTFAICCRPSACRLSVVCRLSVTLVHPTQAIQIFGNISTALGTWAIRWHSLKFTDIVPGEPLRRGS